MEDGQLTRVIRRFRIGICKALDGYPVRRLQEVEARRYPVSSLVGTLLGIGCGPAFTLRDMARPKPLIIAGAITGGVGLIAFGLAADNHSACNSTLGQLAQGFDHQTATKCVAYNAVWTLGIIVAIIGAALLFAGIILLASRAAPAPRAQLQPGNVPPPPGWYAHPASASGRAWWDGTRWLLDQG